MKHHRRIYEDVDSLLWVNDVRKNAGYRMNGAFSMGYVDLDREERKAFDEDCRKIEMSFRRFMKGAIAGNGAGEKFAPNRDNREDG